MHKDTRKVWNLQKYGREQKWEILSSDSKSFYYLHYTRVKFKQTSLNFFLRLARLMDRSPYYRHRTIVNVDCTPVASSFDKKNFASSLSLKKKKKKKKRGKKEKSRESQDEPELNRMYGTAHRENPSRRGRETRVL